MTRRRVSLRWPAAVAVGVATLVIATSRGVFPGVTVTLSMLLTLGTLAVWRPE